MQALIPIDWQDLIGQGVDWLQRNVLLPALLAQAICVLLCFCSRWLGRAKAAATGAEPRRARCGRSAAPIAVAVAGVAGWIALLLLLWFARLAFNGMDHRADLLRLAESLVLVWVLIRLSSMLVRDERLARAVAGVAWIIAALNIAGLITPVIGLLDAMAVPVGNYRLSLLLLLKGAITLATSSGSRTLLARLVEQRLRAVHAVDAGGAGAGSQAGPHDAADAGGGPGAGLDRHRSDRLRGLLRRSRRRRRLRFAEGGVQSGQRRDPVARPLHQAGRRDRDRRHIWLGRSR